MIGKVEYLKADFDGCGVELTDPYTDCNDHFPNAVIRGGARTLDEAGIHHQTEKGQKI